MPSKVRRVRWLVIALGAALGVLGVVTWSLLTPASYTANADAFVRLLFRPDEGDPFSGSPYVLQRMDSYAQLATSSEVLEGVAQDLQRNDVIELRNQVRATVTPGTVILRVTVEDGDPQTAARIANLVVTHLGRSVAALEGGDWQSAASPVQVLVVEHAIVPPGPSGPGHLTIAVIGLLTVVMVGSVVVYFTRSRGDANDHQNAFESHEPSRGAEPEDVRSDGDRHGKSDPLNLFESGRHQ